MFQNWPEHTAHVKKSFGELGKNHPKMLQAYGALEQAAAAEALDAKTRELIALAVAITTRCESCISVHAAAAAKAGATESEIAGALATAISLNAGAASLMPCVLWRRLTHSVDFVSKGRLKTTPVSDDPSVDGTLLFAAEPFRLMFLFNRLEKQP